MTKSTIIKKVDIWKKKLGLINWQISVDFHILKYPKNTESFVGIARTQCQATYKLATISFDPKKLPLVDNSVILHELLHCLFADLVGYSRANIDHKVHDKAEAWLEHFEEGLVSEIERIILRLHKSKP